MFREVAKISPKFWFQVREISRNSRKISQNTELKISRNYENENFRSHPIYNQQKELQKDTEFRIMQQGERKTELGYSQLGFRR